MALNKQIHIYSLDTSALYTEEEAIIDSKISQARFGLSNEKKKTSPNKDEISEYNFLLKKLKEELKKEFINTKNKKIIRTVNNSNLIEKNVISVFDSILTRTLNMDSDGIRDDIIIIKTFYFEVLEDIILDGFFLNDEKYIYYASSSGQIRTKKSVFMKKSLWDKHKNTLMCGLSIEDINNKGGINTNKFNAYLALNNSATDEFNKLNIDKCIVVNDFTFKVIDNVDYIDTKSFDITNNKNMEIPIDYMDGCGIMLPTVNDKNMMIRAPFIKGILTPFDFIKFIEEYDCPSEESYIIKDIYGKEHDIIKDDIQVIFTKSQFKLHGYYEDWDDYKDKFKKNNCKFAYANEEEKNIKDAKLNYQMLQTLTETTDDELFNMSKNTIDIINKIGSDKDTMLRVLGAHKLNYKKNYYQKSIELYNPLLRDEHSKEVIKQVKKSIVRDAWCSKLYVSGKYTFIIPDIYGFCEELFFNKKNPQGLLKRGQVSCNLYDEKKIACLRAPHLYREWGIRDNVINEDTKKWFHTNAVYVSSDDLLSKLIMNDWDGDKSLVLEDDNFIPVAIKHMKDIRPLYYEMATAKKEILTSKSIYEGLILSYTGGNIGEFSNNISKILDNADGDYDLDLVKILVAMNNFVIDFAKTKFKPTLPKKIEKEIKRKTNRKVPNFFIYAKDKSEDNVEPINNNVVNRLRGIIKNKRIKFNVDDIDVFNYKMLLYDKNVKIDDNIVNKYKEFIKYIKYKINKDYDFSTDDIPYVYLQLREELLMINSDIRYVSDVLVKYLYESKAKNKNGLWHCFGHIIYENIKNNLSEYVVCEVCGRLVKKKSNKATSTRYCSDCKNKILQEQRAEINRKYYQNRKIKT